MKNLEKELEEFKKFKKDFKYEVKDNYITKVIIDEDGEKYEYEIFYEN